MYITHCYYLFFSTEDNEKEEPSSNLPLIVGVSVGAVVFLAVVAICVVHCKRSVQRSSHSRVGDGMPAEGGYSKAENYELKQPKPDESDFSLGEKGRLNEGMD